MFASLFPIFGLLYALSLGADALRLVRQSASRGTGARALACVAFVIHTLFLVAEVRQAVADHGAPLSNWFDWCVVAAWLAAGAFLVLSFTSPKQWHGILVLPTVVGLLGLACVFPAEATFTTARAVRLWGAVHGVLLLLGTVAVTVGFSAGVMYLVQSHRLKRKLPPLRGIRLPSLESLGRLNERLLIWSSFFLTSGLIAGWILNAVQQHRVEKVLPWSDPTVAVSTALLFWLLASTVFALLYKPARVGRKVAYLTVASFVLMALTLSIVLFGPSSHAIAPVNSIAGEVVRPITSGSADQSFPPAGEDAP